MFAAWDPVQALKCPTGWIVALSADPAYAGAVSLSLVNQVRTGQRTPVAWGNQNQLSIGAIKNFQAQYGLDACIFQAESAAELETLGVLSTGQVKPGSLVAQEHVVVVGNATAWTASQRITVTMLVQSGEFALIQECYWNVMPWNPPHSVDTQGVPPASICAGIYDASGENPGVGRYVPLSEYIKDGIPNNFSVYLAEGMQPADWTQLKPAGAPAPPPPPPPPAPAPAPAPATVARQKMLAIGDEQEKRWRSGGMTTDSILNTRIGLADAILRMKDVDFAAKRATIKRSVI